jgi:chromosome segregation ATPase
MEWKPVGSGAPPDERPARPKRDRDQMIERLRAKLRSSRAESESLRVALREAEEPREQASPQLLAKLDDMRSQRDRLATERDHLLSLHTALAAETARLRTEYAQSQRSRKDAAAPGDEERTRWEDERRTMESLHRETLDDLQARLDSVRAEATARTDALALERDRLESVVGRLRTELEHARRTHREQAARRDRHDAEQGELASRHEAERNNLSARLDALVADHDVALAERDRLASLGERLRTELDQARRAHREQAARQDLYESERLEIAARHEAERDDLSARLDALAADHDATLAERDRLASVAERLGTELEQARRTHREQAARQDRHDAEREELASRREAERNNLSARLDALAADHDAALGERDRLASLAEGLRTELDQARRAHREQAARQDLYESERLELASRHEAERDALSARLGALAADHGAALGERDRLASLAEHLRSELEQSRRLHREQTASQDGHDAEWEEFASRHEAERNELCARLEALAAGRDAALAERDRFAAERDAVQNRLAQALSQAEPLGAERDALVQEAERLAAELDQARQRGRDAAARSDKERARWEQERRDLTMRHDAELTELRTRLDVSNLEALDLDEVLTERERIQAERDDIAQEASWLREQLEQARRDLAQESARQQEFRAGWEQERQELLARHAHELEEQSRQAVRRLREVNDRAAVERLDIEGQLQAAWQHFEQQIDALRAELEKTCDQRDELVGRAGTPPQDVEPADLAGENQDLQAEVARLTTERDKARRSLASSKRHADGLAEELESLRSEIERLRHPRPSADFSAAPVAAVVIETSMVPQVAEAATAPAADVGPATPEVAPGPRPGRVAAAVSLLRFVVSHVVRPGRTTGRVATVIPRPIPLRALPHPAADPAPTQTAPTSEAMGETLVTVQPAISPAAARRAVIALLLVALALGVLAGLAVCRWRIPYTAAVLPLAMTGVCLRSPDAPGYAGYFRRKVSLPGPIKHGWLAVAARDAFEVTVNGGTAGRLLLRRITRPFQYGLSEVGQVAEPAQPLLPVIYPREYQWSGHRADRLPVFLDLSPRLHPGDNVITVEIESRQAPATLRVDGEVELWSGERIRLDSGPDWRSEPTPPAHQPLDWTDVNYPDRDWRPAEVVADGDPAATGPHARSFDPRVMTTAFGGSWIRHPEAGANDVVWFETTWDVGQAPADAWVRLAVDRPYDLFLNGRRVRVGNSRPPDLDAGDWVYGTQRALDPLAVAESLDPEEVGKVHNGRGFLAPTAQPPARFTQYEGATASTKPHPSGEARAATRADLTSANRAGRPAQQLVGAGRRDNPQLPEASQPLPTAEPPAAPAELGDRTPFRNRLPSYPADQALPALSGDRAVGTVDAYSVRWLLRPGRNKVAVRLTAPASAGSFNWPAQVAIDGEAVAGDGTRASIATGTGAAWSCRRQDRYGRFSPAVAAVTVGPALAPSLPRSATTPMPSMTPRGEAHAPGGEYGAWSNLPPINYRGLTYDPSDQVIDWVTWTGLIALGTLAAAVAMATVACGAGLVLNGRGLGTAAAVEAAARGVTGLLIPPAVALGSALLVECSWAERHEALWFHQPGSWAAVLAAVSVTSVLGLVRSRMADRLVGGAARSLAEIRRSFGGLGRSAVLATLLILIAIGGTLLRVYMLDFQPLDDDEYASVQAVVAIAQTGLPKFVPDFFWYSRSPAYHYLTGAIVAAFGANLWAMRLPAVGFSIATTVLVYFVGARLLRRPWVGLGAAALFAIHPVAVSNGHIVRFYEQQQFFALLATYFFGLGFVRGSGQRYRYLMVAAFLVAVLSQEITAVMGVELALAALLFGCDKGPTANLKLLVVAGCAVAAVALDFLVFQTRCLTRLEGVSPVVEAAVKPHFWTPYNLAAMFVGSSRLHLVPGLLLLLALPALGRGKDRMTWALLWFLASGILLTNLFVTSPRVQYTYRLLPVWMLLVTLAIAELSAALARSGLSAGGTRTRLVRPAVAAVLFLGVLLSWSPWRVAFSHETKQPGDSTGALRYVRSQLGPEDLVIAHEPHAMAAVYECGRVDGALMVPVFHDFFMLDGGRVVDRNSGAEAVGSLDQLRELCRRGRRVWVVVNREKFLSLGNDIDWGYPGARVELFLRKNMEIKHRSYQWTVYLWDPGRGISAPFRQNGNI